MKRIHHFLMFLLLQLLTISIISRKEVLASISADKNKIVCRDHNGEEVPWFFIYKFTGEASSTDPLIQNGTKYAYLVASESGWEIAEEGLDNVNSLFGRTLSPIFSNDYRNVGYIMYAKRPPKVIVSNGTWGKEGHANGIIVADNKSGVWITHTLLAFPQPVSKIENLNLERFMKISFTNKNIQHKKRKHGKPLVHDNIYAQSMFCLSVELPTIELIGNILHNIQAYIFDLKWVPSLNPFLRISDKQGVLVDLPQTCMHPYETYSLKTVSKNQSAIFQLFVKKPECKIDFFSETLPNMFQTNFYVQTYRLHGNRKNLPSNCGSKYNVYNIRVKKIKNKIIGDIDHSKWAVGINKKGDVKTFCISDLNRRYRHRPMNRGGVIMCSDDPNLSNAFANIIYRIEKC